MFEQLFHMSNYSFNPHAVPIMVVSLLIFSIGLLIIVQTKRTVRDVAFFLFCMSSTLWLFTMGFVYSSKDPNTALLCYKIFTFFGVINLTPNLYLFAAAVSGLLDKQRVFVIITYIVTYSIYFLALTTDKFITAQEPYFWGNYPHYEPLNYIFLVTFLIVFSANQVHLKLAHQKESVPIKKNQIRMIKLSLIFGLTAFIDFAAKIWRVPVYPVGFISMFILICLLAYSIIRYRAFDIETVIHKTALWILSFSIIIVPLLLIYKIILPSIVDSQLWQITFWGSSFIVFAVYMRKIQPKIDHFFQRRKADLEEISNRFAEDLVQLKGIDNVIRRIKEVITNALYPQRVDIYIYNEKKKKYLAVLEPQMGGPSLNFGRTHNFLVWLSKNNKIIYRDFIEIDPQYSDIVDDAKAYFEKTKAIVVVPLVLNETLLGVIHLDKKANLGRYNALDFQFLVTLKNQSAIAISNSLIYQNIEEQVALRTEELVETQRQLIQAEKMATVGTLSGGVAHEINNPLTAILTNVQMLLKYGDEETVEERKDTLELIEVATQQCKTIVTKLMDYAKKPIEETDVKEVDLLDVLQKVTKFLGYQFEIDGIKIHVDAKEKDYRVMGNHNELEQVLTNIILNARDAIKEVKQGGCIDVTLIKDDQFIQIWIQDEGKGMSEEIKGKVFDPFFTTKDVGKGLGLGLSICHSIVEKHHGKIGFQSAEGKGTIFTIKFPKIR